MSIYPKIKHLTHYHRCNKTLPGVIIVILQWLIRFVIPIIIPGTYAVGVFGGLLGWIAIIVWWAFLSRAPRFDRWCAVVLMIIALFAIRPLIHKSIGTALSGM